MEQPVQPNWRGHKEFEFRVYTQNSYLLTFSLQYIIWLLVDSKNSLDKESSHFGERLYFQPLGMVDSPSQSGASRLMRSSIGRQ